MVIRITSTKVPSTGNTGEEMENGITYVERIRTRFSESGK